MNRKGKQKVKKREGKSQIEIQDAKKMSKVNLKFYRRILNYMKSHWLGLLSLLIALIGLWFYFKDKRLDTTTGYLSSRNPPLKKYISVGSVRFIIDAPNNVFLRDDDVPVLSLREANHRLFVSTTIRNENGELIAELLDNEWKLNKNAIFDRNYTDNILEVREQNGRVALQVVDFGDTIHVEGIFRCRNGWTTVLGHVEGGALMDIKPPGSEPKFEIRQICRYPSDQHLGSCPGVESLSELIDHSPNGNAYRLSGSLDICSKPNKSN